MTLPMYPSYLSRQAAALIDDIAAHDPQRLQSLREDPLGTVGAWPEISLQWEERRAGGSGCSVDGWYSRDGTIHLVRGGNSERLHFTACHELGHHLQRRHPDVALALAQYNDQDPQRKLEDRICDTFASRVLIPDEALPEVGRLGPTASDVIAVYEATRASRAACVVRLADELDHEGWVILAAPDGEIIFAAAAHQEFRLRPGTRQPGSSLITRAGSQGHVSGLESVTYPSGKTSPQFNADAELHEGYVFAVMSTGATPWSPAPVSNRDRWARPPEFECESTSCSTTFTDFERRCATCDQPFCPECNRCRCSTARNSRVCLSCYMQRPETELPVGATVCQLCRDDGR